MLCGEYVHSEYSMSACLFCIHECNKVAAPPNSEWKALACAQKKSVFLNTAAAADTALWNTHGNVDNAAFITFLRPSVDKQSWRSWVGAECRKAKMKSPGIRLVTWNLVGMGGPTKTSPEPTPENTQQVCHFALEKIFWGHFLAVLKPILLSDKKFSWQDYHKKTNKKSLKKPWKSTILSVSAISTEMTSEGRF